MTKASIFAAVLGFLVMLGTIFGIVLGGGSGSVTFLPSPEYVHAQINR